jgi:N-acetylmuramoyl-L-alanine amidase
MLNFNSTSKIALIIFICFGWNFASLAAEYVTFTPKNGEALMQIFKKYKIIPNATNINHFKEINNVKKLNKLLTGKNYKLPILKVPFDGRSIASSIPNITKSSAVSVMDYNNLLFKKQVRKKPYIKNKIVWIVYDEWKQIKKATKTSSNEAVREEVSLKSPSKTKSTTRINRLNDVVVITRNSPVKALNSAPEKAEDNFENKEIAIEEKNELKKSSEETGALSNASLHTKVVPVFGPDFEEIRIQSDVLKNKVYYLVSGHGGPDPGTMFHGDEHILCEDEYAYDVTLRLARKLMEQGAKVYLIVQDPDDGIRNESYLKLDKDERCITGYPLVLNQKLRLTQTTDATNDLYRANRKKGVADQDQLAIHIHVDSRHKDMRKDVFFYYQENNKTSEDIANRIQQTLEQKYLERSGREYTGTVSSRNLFVMRNTIPSTVYMELGNIQNDDDQKRLLIPSNRQALAEWLYDGIAGE